MNIKSPPTPDAVESPEDSPRAENIVETCLEIIASVQVRERKKYRLLDKNTQRTILGRFDKGSDFAERSNKIFMPHHALLAPIDPIVDKYWQNPKIGSERTIFLGVMGTGKTHRMLQTSRKYFTLYTTAADENQDRDSYFGVLERLLTNLKLDGERHQQREQRNNEAVQLIMKWITFKWICLLHLLRVHEQYTPDEFLFNQLNGESSYFTDCFNVLEQSTEYKRVWKTDWASAHAYVTNQIKKLTGHDKIGFAVDEAQILFLKHTNL
jgi:hypothetical protein